MKSTPEFKKSSESRSGNGKKGAFEKTPIDASCVHPEAGHRSGFTKKAYVTKSDRVSPKYKGQA